MPRLTSSGNLYKDKSWIDVHVDNVNKKKCLLNSHCSKISKFLGFLKPQPHYNEVRF
jgi:hypothetical protein